MPSLEARCSLKSAVWRRIEWVHQSANDKTTTYLAPSCRLSLKKLLRPAQPRSERGHHFSGARLAHEFPRSFLVAAIIFPHTKWLKKITDYRDTPALIGGATTSGSANRRFTRRADRRLPPGCYGNLIVNVKRGQSRPKRACGVDPDRHVWATFTFTVIAEVRSCCTEMTEES